MSETEVALHALSITQVPDEESDDINWTTSCPGLNRTCTVWFACAEVVITQGSDTAAAISGCSHTPTEDEIDAGEYEAHEQHHEMIDGDWMTPSNRCALDFADISEDVWEIARTKGIGTYQVEVDYQGDGEWRALLVEPTPTNEEKN